jgi:hypothetical protein
LFLSWSFMISTGRRTWLVLLLLAILSLMPQKNKLALCKHLKITDYKVCTRSVWNTIYFP